MPRFLSPGERRVLAELPPAERAWLTEFMEVFDAHIIDCEPARAPKRDESPQMALLEPIHSRNAGSAKG